MKKNQLLDKKMLFVILVSAILLVSYGFFISSANLFQIYVKKNNIASLFPRLAMIGFLITVSIMMLNLFDKMQALKYQRILMFVLLISFVFLPVKLWTYPIIAGISNAVYNLAEPWRQLFIPPAYRATIVGVATTLCALVDLRSTQVEHAWAFDLMRYRAISIILVLCAIIFWFLAKSCQKTMDNAAPDLKITPTSNENSEPKLGIRKLVFTYPYIFVFFILSGLNGGMFYYTYFLASKALPHTPASIYQYVIYVGSFTGPTVIGFIADSVGIYSMLLITGTTLTIAQFSLFGLALTHVQTPMVYYAIVFIEAALSQALWILSASLVGERLLKHGIFRSFAISNMAFIFGNIMCSRIFVVFSTFEHIKFMFGILDFLIMGLIIYLNFLDTPTRKSQTA